MSRILVTGVSSFWGGRLAEEAEAAARPRGRRRLDEER